VFVMSNEIRRYFPCLFGQGEFQLISETHFESFANWAVVFASQEYCIRFMQDRSEVDIAIGPACPQPNWEFGPWFNLSHVLYYLTKGKLLWNNNTEELGSLAEQLTTLSNVYCTYSKDICGLFT
jgi:hypothetical protein